MIWIKAAGFRALSIFGGEDAEPCEERPMPEKIDDLLPMAKEIQKQAAIKEAEKADQQAYFQRQVSLTAEIHDCLRRLVIVQDGEVALI